MKAFVSPIVAALAAIAFIALASTLAPSGAISDSAATEAMARSCSWRWQDADAALSASAMDALVDSSFSACNCANSNSTGIADDFPQRAAEYSALAYAQMGPANALDAQLALSQFSAQASAPSSCNSTVIANYSYHLYASNLAAKREGSALHQAQIEISKNSLGVQMNAMSDGVQVANLTVKCN